MKAAFLLACVDFFIKLEYLFSRKRQGNNRVCIQSLLSFEQRFENNLHNYAHNYAMFLFEVASNTQFDARNIGFRQYSHIIGCYVEVS